MSRNASLSITRSLSRLFGRRSNRPEADVSPLCISTPDPHGSTFSQTNGTLGLPIEIWEEIYKITTTLTAIDSSHEFQSTESTFGSLVCEPSIMTKPFESQSPKIFTTRRAIVLVCKSWYAMGIKSLQSHLFLNMSWNAQKLIRIYHTLKNDAMFAARVIRLSVKEGPIYQSADPRQDVKRREALHLLVPLLVNVRILSCPSELIRHGPSRLRPEIAIVLRDPTSVVAWNHSILCLSNFSNSLRTLFIHFQFSPEHYGSHTSSTETLLRFPNLINLRMEVPDYHTMEWIGRTWHLQQLKTLSISTHWPFSCLSFIQKEATQIESLEIIPAADGAVHCGGNRGDIYQLVLPRLKRLCICYSRWESRDGKLPELQSILVLPRLDRLCYHIDSPIYYLEKSLNDAAHVAVEGWPTLKEVAISYRAMRGRECKPVWKDGHLTTAELHALRLGRGLK